MIRVGDLPHCSGERDRLASGTTSVRVSRLTRQALERLQVNTVASCSRYASPSVDELVYRLVMAALLTSELP